MKTRKYITIIVTTLGVISLGVFLYVLNTVKAWEDKAFPQSYIEGINVSGKSKKEIISMLNNKKENFVKEKLKFKYEENNYEIPLTDLDSNINIENIAHKAVNYGKNGDLFEKYKKIIYPNKRNYSMNIDYNDSKLKKFINEITKGINREFVNASLKLTDGKIVLEKETHGRKVDENKLYYLATKKIKLKNNNDAEIGHMVEKISPKITEKELQTVNTVVSSFSTTYSTSTLGRSENIRLAVERLNGTLIMPGEIFSFNKIIGPRRGCDGFQNAPIIVKNKLEDGIGGGVCQVSTTLYNAIIRTSIKATERKNHSLAPAYISPGYDATVSDNIDYKFKNTLAYPIYIQGIARGGRITFKIYSDSSLLKTRYELANEIVEKNIPKVTYNKVNTLPEGITESVQNASVGYKVKTYLIAYEDGKEIKRELISKDVYHKVDGVINIGI